MTEGWAWTPRTSERWWNILRRGHVITRTSFEQEFVAMLQKSEIDYDPRFIFGWLCRARGNRDSVNTPTQRWKACPERSRMGWAFLFRSARRGWRAGASFSLDSASNLKPDQAQRQGSNPSRSSGEGQRYPVGSPQPRPRRAPVLREACGKGEREVSPPWSAAERWVRWPDERLSPFRDGTVSCVAG